MFSHFASILQHTSEVFRFIIATLDKLNQNVQSFRFMVCVCGALHTAPESVTAVLRRLTKMLCTIMTALTDFEGRGQPQRRINQRRATSGWQ